MATSNILGYCTEGELTVLFPGHFNISTAVLGWSCTAVLGWSCTAVNMQMAFLVSPIKHLGGGQMGGLVCSEVGWAHSLEKSIMDTLLYSSGHRDSCQYK